MELIFFWVVGKKIPHENEEKMENISSPLTSLEIITEITHFPTLGQMDTKRLIWPFSNAIGPQKRHCSMKF